MIKYIVYKLVNCQSVIVCLIFLAFCCGCVQKNEKEEIELKNALQHFQDTYYSALIKQDPSLLSDVVTEAELPRALEFYNRNLSGGNEIIFLEKGGVGDILVLESDNVHAIIFVDLIYYQVKFNKLTGEAVMTDEIPRKSAATIHMKFVDGIWKFNGPGSSN